MICHKTLVAISSKLSHILKKSGKKSEGSKKIGKKSEESEYFGMSEYFGGVWILRKSPNTSERPNTSEEPNTSDRTEYFGLKRFFNLLISHGTEVFANSSVWPNTSDPNTSESEYFGFYYSATIRPIPSYVAGYLFLLARVSSQWENLNRLIEYRGGGVNSPLTSHPQATWFSNGQNNFAIYFYGFAISLKIQTCHILSLLLYLSLLYLT